MHTTPTHTNRNDHPFEYFSSPIGNLKVGYHQGALCSIDLAPNSQVTPPHELSAISLSLQQEIKCYLNKGPHRFSVPIYWEGMTPFQRKVCYTLFQNPLSTTLSYRELAVLSGHLPRHARAVGQACAKNPIPIVIPCHLVVASAPKGSPHLEMEKRCGGFAWGLPLKKKLLQLTSSFNQ